MAVMSNPRKSVLRLLVEKHFEFPKRKRHTRSLLDLAKINAHPPKRSVVPINIEKWLDFRLEKGQIRGINSGLICIMGVGLGIIGLDGRRRDCQSLMLYVFIAYPGI